MIPTECIDDLLKEGKEVLEFFGYESNDNQSSSLTVLKGKENESRDLKF